MNCVATQPMNSQKRRGEAGFTLIELMIALVVSGIVLAGVFAFSGIQNGSAAIHQRRVRIDQALEGAMHTIGRDIQSAALGFGRTCTEVRVWDDANNRLLNPGAIPRGQLANVPLDDITDEPYWVLRDGLQAHWRSSGDDGATSIQGDQLTSASPTSSADSFDVVLAERHFTSGFGIFTADSPTDLSSGADTELVLAEHSPLLDVANGDHTNWVRHLFPPGSFLLLAPPSTSTVQPFAPQHQSQCVLLQVTGDVDSEAGRWRIPIGNRSSFNADLEALMDKDQPGDVDDWKPESWGDGVHVIPLGRFRWSRYEIDYRTQQRPYLVRSDIIGWREGDPEFDAAIEYPTCDGNSCRIPQLHLPSADGALPPRIVVGPMIEDMQVAVGCDGYQAGTDELTELELDDPDVGFAERGPKAGGAEGPPNHRVDEWDTVNDRGNDEWLGNSPEEEWAPDCVYYGTAEINRDVWPTEGPASERRIGPGFRMSPQVFRLTLLGRSESMVETVRKTGDAVSDESLMQLFAIEDRAKTTSFAPQREYRTLTERFAPRNLRWRDPGLP